MGGTGSSMPEPGSLSERANRARDLGQRLQITTLAQLKVSVPERREEKDTLRAIAALDDDTRRGSAVAESSL